METAKGAGRVVGVMVLAQMTAAFLVNQFLLGPVFAPPGYLVNAAARTRRCSRRCAWSSARRAIGRITST